MNPEKSIRGWKQRYAVIAVLAGVAALFVAGLIPLVATSRLPATTVASTVNAASSDVIVVSEPIQLNTAPSIVLEAGRLVAGPRSAVGSRTLVLEEGYFVVDLSSVTERFGEFGPSKGEAGRPPIAAQSVYAQLSALGFDRIKIVSASARVRWDGFRGIEIADLGLDLTPRRTGPVTATGSFKFDGDPYEFSVAVGNWVAVDFENRKFGRRAGIEARSGDIIGPLTKATIKGRTASASFDGQLAFSSKAVAASGDISATVDLPAKLLSAFGFAGVDDLEIEPIMLSGPAIWRDKQLTSESATFRIGDQNATGAVVLGVRDERPLIEGTLSLDRLDLAPYVAALKRNPAGGRNAPDWSATPVDLRIARSIDADVRLSTNQLYAGENMIGRGSATIAIRKGKLNADIADLELQFLKGTMQLNADMMGTEPIYSIRSRFETTDTRWLARALSIDSSIRGKVACTADLTGIGITLGKLLENARGRITMKASDGVIIPINTVALRSALKASGDVGAKEWKAILSDAKVDEVDISGHVIHGRLVIDRAQSRDSGSQTILTGTIDRVSRAIDAKIFSGPTPAAPRSTARNTKVAPEIERATHMVRGTIDSPRLELAPSGPQQ